MTKGSRLVFTTDPEQARRLRESGAMPEARDLAPSEQTICVAVDRRKRKGKSVTVARGFRLTPESLEKVARQLKQRCAAGGTAEGDSIEVQGEHVDAVAAVLQGFGYRVKRV